MKIAIVLTMLAALAAAQPVTQAEPPKPAPGEGARLNGKVVDAASGAPLAGVRVQLNRYPVANLLGGLWSYTATTGEKGEFVLTEMVADRYVLNATKPGFGLTRGTHRSVTLAKGGTSDVTWRMFAASKVEGVVEDADRKPIANIGVELLRESWGPQGRELSNAVLSVRTNAEGKFSFPDVLGGTYYAFATQGSLQNFQDTMLKGAPRPALTYSDTFYPNAPDPERAAPILVSPGLDQTGLRIEMGPAVYRSVKGKVVGIPEGVKNVRTRLQRMSGDASQASLGIAAPWASSPMYIAADGTFSITNVAPGSYVVSLMGVRGGTRIQVRDKDLTDIEIRALPVWKLSGTIVFEDGTAPGPPSEPMMASIETSTTDLGNDVQIIRSPAGGAFAIPSLLPGSYRLSFPDFPDLTVRKIEVGGRTFEGGRFDFAGPDVERAVFTVARKGASIGGSVERNGENKYPSGAVTLSMFPTDPLNWPLRRTALLNGTDSFHFGPLEAGQYRLCAWTDEASIPRVFGNPRFEQRLAGDCKNVTVKADASEQVQLKWIDPASFQ